MIICLFKYNYLFVWGHVSSLANHLCFSSYLWLGSRSRSFQNLNAKKVICSVRLNQREPACVLNMASLSESVSTVGSHSVRWHCQG